MQELASRHTARLAMLALLSSLSVAALAQTSSSCKALVQVENNLWLASADGKPIAQVTNDRQFRSAAALSPDGKVIAYSGKDSPDDVTLIEASGRPIADIDLNARDAIVDLEWATPTLLRAAEHAGPNASHFHHVRLGAGNTGASVLGATADGTSCAMSPTGNVTACVIGKRDVTRVQGRCEGRCP